jgi:hypothetical protein
MKLYFYSNAGQALILGVERSDPYKNTANAWSQLKSYGSPLQGRAVTYNFILTPDAQAVEFDSGNAVWWGDDVDVIDVLPGMMKYLCTGSPDKCPTPKLLVAERRRGVLEGMGGEALEAFKEWSAPGDVKAPLGDRITKNEPLKNFVADIQADPELAPLLKYITSEVPPEAWTHRCDGILGECGHGANELHWIACTSIVVAKPATPVGQQAAAIQREMPTLETAAASGPGFDPSAWKPARDGNGNLDGSDSVIQGIRKRNADNINATPNKGTISLAVGGGLVLIGPGHDSKSGDYVGRQADRDQAQIEVTKSPFKSSNKLLQVKGLTADSSKSLVASELQLLPEWRFIIEGWMG